MLPTQIVMVMETYRGRYKSMTLKRIVFQDTCIVSISSRNMSLVSAVAVRNSNINSNVTRSNIRMSLVEIPHSCFAIRHVVKGFSQNRITALAKSLTV